VRTALMQPRPEPNAAVARRAIAGANRSSGSDATPMAPNPASRVTATTMSVAISSRPRAAITSRVVTGGSCSTAPLLVMAWLMPLLAGTKTWYGMSPVFGRRWDQEHDSALFGADMEIDGGIGGVRRGW